MPERESPNVMRRSWKSFSDERFLLVPGDAKICKQFDALAGVVVQFENTQEKLGTPQRFFDISLKLACISFLSG